MQDFAVFTTRLASQKAAQIIAQLCEEFNLRCAEPLSHAQASCTAIQALISTGDFTALRKAAHRAKIDVNLVPKHNRKKKLLLADMDATIICGESLDELAKLAGIGQQVGAITAQTMAGEITFEQGLSARLALLTGCDAKLLEQVVQNTQITQGAKTLIATMREAGAHCYLISGGFTFLSRFIAESLGFTGHHANQIEISQGQLTGKAVLPLLGQQAKLEYLQHYQNFYHLTTDDIAAIGDGANDLMMLKEAGMGVAFEGKKALRAGIALQLSYSDLTGLLYLQGFRSVDFST